MHSVINNIKAHKGSLISDDFKKSAASLRKQITAEMDKQIKEAIPTAKKGNGRFWTIPLNDNAYFYISMVLPKYLDGDSRFEIIYHVSRVDQYKPTESMYGFKQNEIKFPYRIHHQLFEFPETPWWKPKVGYLYWKLLMQSRKIYYYTPQQTEYSSRILIPYAVLKLREEYNRQEKIYKGNDKVPKDIYA